MIDIFVKYKYCSFVTDNSTKRWILWHINWGKIFLVFYLKSDQLVKNWPEPYTLFLCYLVFCTNTGWNKKSIHQQNDKGVIKFHLITIRRHGDWLFEIIAWWTEGLFIFYCPVSQNVKTCRIISIDTDKWGYIEKHIKKNSFISVQLATPRGV